MFKPRSALQRLAQKLNSVILLESGEVHSAYAPESILNTTREGRRLKAAALAKKRARPVFTGGRPTRWYKKSNDVVEPIMGGLESPGQKSKGLTPVEGKPRGSQVFRHKVLRPGVSYAHPGQQWTTVTKEEIKPGEVVHKQPVYEHAKDPKRFLRAKFDNLPNPTAGLSGDFAQEKLRLAKRDFLEKYTERAQSEAGEKVGKREIRAKVLTHAEGEMQNIRDYAAGELRESRAIIKARGASPLSAKAHPERMVAYKKRLGELVTAHQSRTDKAMTHAEGRLQNIAARGYLKNSPQPISIEEGQRRGRNLVNDISSRENYAGALLGHEQTKLTADILEKGAKVSKGITPERVSRLKTIMDSARDRATKPGESALKNKIVRSGELFNNAPKATAAAPKKYLGKIGIGVGAAALLGGGAALAIRARRHRDRELSSRMTELRFAELPPEAQRLLDKVAKKTWDEGQRKLASGGASVTGGSIIHSPRMRRQKVLTRYRRMVNQAAVQKILARPDLATHPNAPNWKGLYEEKVSHAEKLKQEMRTKDHIHEDALKAQEEEHLNKVGVIGRAKYEHGHRIGVTEESTRGKAVRDEQAAALTQKLGKESDRRATKLKWIGAGGVAAGAIGGYAVGSQDHKSRNRYAALQESRFEERKKRDGTLGHDAAIGAVEGAAGVFATDKIMQRINPAGGSAGKAVVGGVIGGVSTAAIGLGLNRLIRSYRKRHQKEMSSKLHSIHFQDPRVVVARDRYRKDIHERDVDRAGRLYVRTGLIGAGIGALTRKSAPLSQAILTGAAAGVGAQGLARAYSRTTRDQFGDRSFPGKRVDRAPLVVGAGVLGTVAASKLLKRLKGVKKFSSITPLIRFEDDDQNKDWLATYARKKLYKRDYATSGQVQKVKKYTGRTHRLLRDVNLKRQGLPNIDERGRPRRNEWERPWVAAAVTTGVIGGGVLAVKGLRNFVKSAPLDTKIGPLREGFMRGGYTKKVPGLGKAGEIYHGAKKELKDMVNPVVKKPKYDVSSVNPKTGKPKSPGQVAKEESNEKAVSILDKITSGTIKKKDFSQKLREIRFAQTLDSWDISDRSTGSAVVHAPGSQRRQRRPKEWYEKKGNQRLMWEGALGAAGVAAIGGGLYARKRGIRLGRATEKAAQTIGSTGKPVNYATGEQLDHVWGPFSIVRKKKPPIPAVSTEFSEKENSVKKNLLAGGVGTGLALGTYSVLRHRMPLKAGASPQLQALRKAAEGHGLARVTVHDRIPGRALSKGPTLWQKLSTEIAQPADVHQHIVEGGMLPKTESFKGAVFDPDEQNTLRSKFTIGKSSKIGNRINSGKLEEYKTLKGAGVKGLAETLPIGPGGLKKGFIAKPARGSMAGSVVTQKMIQSHDPKSAKLKSFLIHQKDVMTRIKDPSRQAKALQRHGGYKDWMTSQVIKNPKRFVQQRQVKIAKEYRVHLLGGRRLGVSSGRYGPGLTAKAETAAEGMFKNASPGLKKNLLGVDVAKDTRGGWHVIETNPGAQSGFLAPTNKLDIRGPNKMYHRITGRYSKPASALAAGTAGLAGAGATARTRDKRQPRPALPL